MGKNKPVCNSVKLFITYVQILKKVTIYIQQGREILFQIIRHTYARDVNMHSQQKALTEKCYVNKVVQQKPLCFTLLCLCDENPWEIPVKDFYFTWFTGLQPAIS